MGLKDDILESLKPALGASGRVLSISKSFYRSSAPDHFVVFNSMLSVEGLGDVWRGDIDLSVASEEEALHAVARLAKGKKVSIAHEFAGYPYYTCYIDPISDRLKTLYDETIYFRNASGRLVVKGESLESTINRLKDSIQRDRESMSDDDLFSLEIPFPYEILAQAAASKKSSEVSPIVAFALHVQKAAEELRVMEVHLRAVIHADDEEFLERSEHRFVKKRNRYFSDKYIEDSVKMALFNYGPQSFVKAGTPDCIKKGTIRIKRPG